MALLYNSVSHPDITDVRGCDTPLRIAFFGTFYPETQYAGNSSTGIVAAISKSPRVNSVIVYAQAGAKLPPSLDSTRVNIVEAWQHNNPLSIASAMFRMIGMSACYDAYLFNTYVTAMGKSSLANVVGMLTPSIISIVTRKPVVVYLHNIVETQDIERLGYNASIISRGVAHSLESILLNTTDVVVPLESQRAIIEKVFRRAVHVKFLPNIEVYAFVRSPPERDDKKYWKTDRYKVLLFGHWGPQKDLKGALQLLREISEKEGSIEVVIAGTPNERFPNSFAELNSLKEALEGPTFHFVGRINEEDVFGLISSADLYFLPYNASGGYSGAMNSAALSGTKVLCYDYPQLRETAKLMNIDATFMKPGDPATLRKLIDENAELSKEEERQSRVNVEEGKLATERTVEFLAELMKFRS